MVDAQAEKQIFVAPGANHNFSVADVQRASSLLRSTKVLLMQYELPLAPLIKAAQIAHGAGARIVVDPAPARPTPRQLLRLIDVIRPNASEAKTLTGLTIDNAAMARRAARKLLALGVSAVAVPIGDKGDLII